MLATTTVTVPPVPDGTPFGSFDSAAGRQGGTAHVVGWTIDPNALTAAANVHVYVDGPAGSGARFIFLGPANTSRPDVAAVNPGAGEAHGFDTVVTGLSPGAHTLWAYALNAAGDGANRLLGALRLVVPPNAAPRHRPADFDGDGDTDVSVFRPSNSYWFANGGATTQFGTTGDIPVPGDYDGDGDTDIAVFRPANGYWFVNGGAITQFGTNGDIPVPGDYDGDGDTDIAVFRPAYGYWFVNGGAITPFGTSGDRPLPLPAAIRQVFSRERMTPAGFYPSRSRPSVSQPNVADGGLVQASPSLCPLRAFPFALTAWRAAPAGWRTFPKASRPTVPGPVGRACRRVSYSSVQPQELISRTITPFPVSIWVVHGMQGSKLRTARRTSRPLIWSSGTDSSSGVSTTACS